MVWFDNICSTNKYLKKIWSIFLKQLNLIWFDLITFCHHTYIWKTFEISFFIHRIWFGLIWWFLLNQKIFEKNLKQDFSSTKFDLVWIDNFCSTNKYLKKNWGKLFHPHNLIWFDLIISAQTKIIWKKFEANLPWESLDLNKFEVKFAVTNLIWFDLKCKTLICPGLM